jgi:hypothetical protein
MSQPPSPSVLITHPLHPFTGRELPLLGQQRKLGRSFVSVLFPDGRPAVLPVDWTNLRPRPPPLKVGGKCPRLHPGSLLELRALIDGLRDRHDEKGQEASAAERRFREPTHSGQARRTLHRPAGVDEARTARRPGRRAAEGRAQDRFTTRGKR